MRKGAIILLLTVLALACSRHPLPERMVQFTVSLETDLTKAVADASLATQLLVGVFDQENHPLFCSQATRTAGNPFTFTLPLLPEMNYRILFFAQAPGEYVGSFTSAGQLRSIGVPTTMTLNGEAYDAFVGIEEISGAATSHSVLLSHAWAQVNVASSLDIGDVTGAQFSLSGVPATLDLLSGTTSGSQGVTISGSALGGTFVSGGTSYNYIGYAYIPVGTGQTLVDAAVTLTRTGGEPSSLQVDNVPLMANYRTNIIGEL